MEGGREESAIYRYTDACSRGNQQQKRNRGKESPCQPRWPTPRASPVGHASRQSFFLPLAHQTRVPLRGAFREHLVIVPQMSHLSIFSFLRMIIRNLNLVWSKFVKQSTVLQCWLPSSERKVHTFMGEDRMVTITCQRSSPHTLVSTISPAPRSCSFPPPFFFLN